MVIITFPNGSDWYESNWVFRQFAEDVVATCPQDAELKFALDRAQVIGALMIDRMAEPLAARTLKAMKIVAEQTMEGQLPGWQDKT